MKPNRTKWLWLMATGGTLLQLTACIGDPQYFLVNYAAQWLTSSIITTLFGSLTTTAALLVG